MELFKHNQNIFEQYKSMRDTHKNILIIQGTGLGKTNIAIKIIDTYFKNEPILYVVPKDVLMDSVKRNSYWDFPNVKFICYQSLKKYDPKYYSLCILDEVHRAGSPVWIKSAKRFIESDSCNVLGLTATNIRTDGINIAKKLFNEDDKIQGLSIFEAIDEGILPKPDYVCAELEPEKTIKHIEKSLHNYRKDKRDIIMGKLEHIKLSSFNELKLENIIPKHSNGTKKYIIITPTINECKEWVKIFKNILNTDKIYAIHSKTPEGYNKSKIDYFNSYNEEDNIAIIGVDMLTEGLHIEGASQIIMLRNTTSWLLYIQMIGRVLSCIEKNITPVIYDIYSNYKLHECVEVEGNVLNHESYEKHIIEQSNEIINHVNIVGDYKKDFDEIYKYRKSQNVNWTDEMIEDLKNVNISNSKIAKKYNICVETVQVKRKKLGIKSKFVKDKKIDWDNLDENILKDIQNTELSARYVANKYNISRYGIVSMRKKLGIFIQNTIEWTDEMLKELNDITLSHSYIGKKYNISPSTILSKRKKLGIKINAANSKIVWTDEMLKDLNDITLSHLEIEAKYGINRSVIHDKRQSLGIHRRAYLQCDWNNDIMIDIYNRNLGHSYIAKKYNMDATTIAHKRKTLGIVLNRPKREKIIWTDEMIKDLNDITLRHTDIAKKYNINSSSVLNKRKSLGIKSKYSR